MSKNRIYKIKDKILVQGNENELTENELLVKEENDSVVLKERVNGEVKSISGGNIKIYDMTNFKFINEDAITSNPSGVITYSGIDLSEYEQIKNCETLKSFIFYGASNEEDKENRIPITLQKSFIQGDDVYFSHVFGIGDDIVFFAMKISPTMIKQGMYEITFEE